MFGPAAVLDDYGSATEASGLQNFLQWIPNPYVFERENSDRNAGIQRRQFQILPLAETLSRAIPNTNGCINTNSPYTRAGRIRSEHNPVMIRSKARRLGVRFRERLRISS